MTPWALAPRSEIADVAMLGVATGQYLERAGPLVSPVSCADKP
jgi:hypothetical protein